MQNNLNASGPMVSVLIPAYNVAKFLSCCLDSIINQTYNNVQVVVVDDGSTDNTLDIANSYAERFSFIEVYHQSNSGVSVARNKLISLAKGDFVLFVDGDDWIEKYTIEFLLAKVLDYCADVSTCGMVINNSSVLNDYNERVLTQEEIIRLFLLHKELKGSLCNKLIKKALLYDIKFINEISYGEDALFCWHFFQHTKKMVLTDRQLYHYRMNESSISHQSFGAKKLTGHETWRIITEETAKLWPQHLHIAQARWGLEDMYLLRQAGQSNYKKDDNIEKLQKTVRCFRKQMRETGLLVGREILNAEIICRWYGYNRLYSILNRLKTYFK